VHFQQRQNSRHGRQHRDPLSADGLHQPGRHQSALKVQFRPVNGRDPQPHGLAKHVAQRQRVQNPQRVDQTHIAQIRLRRVFDRPYAGQHVAVCDHNALGIARGAGGEQDLQRRLRRKPWNRPSLFGRQVREPIFKEDLREVAVRPICPQLTQQDRVANCQFGAYVRSHASCKICGPICVQWNRQHTAKQAPVECGNPLRTIFGPDQHAVAGTDAARRQQRRKAPAEPRDFSVCCDSATVALISDNRDFAIVAAKVVEKCSQVVSHVRFLRDRSFESAFWMLSRAVLTR